MRSYSCFKHIFPECVQLSIVTQWEWEREAETGRHISLPLWHILQGYRSQSAWSWLSLTCYESITGWGWSITLGGEVEVGAGGGPRGGRELEGVSVGEAALLPVTHHAPLHDRQPCLARAQWGVWGLAVWAVTGQKDSKHFRQTLDLDRPRKTSLLEATERWISALFPRCSSYFGPT